MSKSPERTSLSAQEAHHIRYGIWLAAVEQLFLSVRSSTSQFVGFTSPKPRSGVTTIAGALSSLSAKAGQKTILLDFSVAPKEQDNKPAWCPGYSDIRQNITRHHDGYDYLVADATTNSRPLFSNVDLLNTSLRAGLQNYDAVFFDLAPVLDRSVYRINPLGPAATCGSVILVCARGRLQRAHAVKASQLLQSSGCKLSGSIMNTAFYTPSSTEILSFTRRWFRVVPPISRWLQQKVQSNEFLQ